MKSPNEFIESLDTVCTGLTEYNDILSSQEFDQLRVRVSRLKEALNEEKEQRRVLRIGIIGSVKAGKSTFLNALLFQGEPILPRAATPMTASLTRLCYAEKPYAKFVFYTQEDWATIESEADKANRQIDDEFARREERRKEQERSAPMSAPQPCTREDVRRTIKLSDLLGACLELVETARKSGINMNSYLGEEETIEITDLANVRKALEDYIGSGGKLTPVVKYVVLGLNDERLRDIEIIDTPGLNDPVRSRSQETYKFMDRCDAVFVLSRASQFMTEDDKNLVVNTLKGCGIRPLVVVATQMDLSALNERREKSYFGAFKKARSHVMKEGQRHGQDVVPVSAFMYACARKMEKKLSLDKEEFHLQEMIGRFERDIPCTPQDYKKYSNMGAVEKQLETWRRNKDELILEHQLNRMRDAKGEILNMLSGLRTSLEKDKRLLKENDIESLKKKHQQIRAAMESVSSQVSDLFLEMGNRVNVELAELRQRVVANSKNFHELTVDKKTETKDQNYTSGMLWWKQNHTTTETVVTYSADLSEALKQLKEFAAQIEKDINDTFKVLLDKENITNRIKKTILPVFRNLDISFDESIILQPVRAVVYSINVPEFKFDNSPYNEALVLEFSDGILNERVSAFKSAFELQIQELIKDVRKKLDNQGDGISSILYAQSADFSQQIIRSLDEQTEKVLQQMKDRERGLLRFDEAKLLLEQSTRKVIGADA